MNEHELEAIQEIRERGYLTEEEVQALGFKLFFVTSRMMFIVKGRERPNVLVHWCMYRPFRPGYRAYAGQGTVAGAANRFTEEEARIFTDWLRTQEEMTDIQTTEMRELTDEEYFRDNGWVPQRISLDDWGCPLKVFGCIHFDEGKEATIRSIDDYYDEFKD